MFLSRETFLLVDQSGYLRVSAFQVLRENNTIPVLQVAFCLPALSPGRHFRSIQFGRNCIPASAFNETSAAPNLPLFLPRQDERILSCALNVFKEEDLEGPGDNFAFVVNVHTLLDPANRIANEEITFAWKDWGPQNTRWVSGQEATNWKFSVYGHRVVEAVRPPTLRGARTGKKLLRIKDFNPYNLLDPSGSRWFRQAEFWRKVRIVDTESVVPAQGAFEYDIVSNLPYREIETAESFAMTSAMLYDDRIILINVRLRLFFFLFFFP
jgi:hypothetical protein